MTAYKEEELSPEDGGRFPRRQFLKTSATAGGAIVLGVNAVGSSAEDELEALNSPRGHFPKPVLTGQMIEYKSGDKAIPAYLARATKKKTAPAVLVIHEVFGLNDHIKSIADRLANQGYNALAPDLFVRAPEPPPKDATDVAALRKAVTSIPNEVAVKDMQAGLDFLKTLIGVRRKFASVGFCMGGGFSYQIATHTNDLAGAVIFYGRTPIELVPQVSCPLLCSFGELDSGIPPAKVKEFEEALKKAGKIADIKIYTGAKHGFFNDTRPEAYNAEAAADAWERMLKFYRERLGV